MGKIQPKVLAAITAVLVLVLVAGFALWPRTDSSVAQPVEASQQPSLPAESETPSASASASASVSPSRSASASASPSTSASASKSTPQASASPSVSASSSPSSSAPSASSKASSKASKTPSSEESQSSGTASSKSKQSSGDKSVKSESKSASGASSGKSSSGANKAAATQECSSASKSFTPTAFTIDRVGAHERVISLGLQNGMIPAPPMNDRRSAAWWNEGPKPGSGQGKVVLTIHTYRPSLRPALGNELYEGGSSALQPGDIIKVHGKNGEIQCYEFTEAPRVFLDEYDEDSTLMLDPHGPESLVIVICWDYNKSIKDWDSRVLFQFKAIS